MGLFERNVSKPTRLLKFYFFIIEKLSYKEDNSPKENSRGKEHFKLDV